MHIKTLFFGVWKTQYDFLALRHLAVCTKQKYFFLMFWWKPVILIPDLYFYGIKIQTNIRAGPNPDIWAGPNYSGPIWPNHEQWLSNFHMLREHWRLATKEKKEEERAGGTDLWWLLWRLTVVLAGDGDAGGEMAVAPGSGLSLFSPLFSFYSSLFFLLPSPPFFFLLVLSSFFFLRSSEPPLLSLFSFFFSPRLPCIYR